MSFAGITNDKQRADVVAFLRSLSDNPPPLPSPEQKATAPAGGASPAASAQPDGAQAAAPAVPAKP